MDDSTRVPPLGEYLAAIPEFRAARGRRHGLLPLLLLVSVAMLCGARGQSAIAAWGRDYGQPWLGRLGFTRGYGPSQPTLSRLFAGVAYAAVEAALRGWAERAMAALAVPGGPEGVALDGKTLRGSRKRGAADAHLLAALSHRLGVVLGQVAVADKTNEIGAAGGLLLTLALEGRVVTADALLTQREVARTILAGGGDYLLVVKENQPTLLWEVAAAFDVGTAAAPPAAEERSQHGGRIETRRLAASPALVGYSDWPGLAQALRLERRVVAKATGAVLREEVAYAVTSLAPERAGPARLLALWRGHWAIGNRLHYVRDVTFDEDRSQVRAGTAPQCMAAFRNLAIGLLRLLGEPNIAAATRRCAAQPARALAAVGLRGDFE